MRVSEPRAGARTTPEARPTARRFARWVAAFGVLAGLAGSAPHAAAANPWWALTGFAGTPVTAVVVHGRQVYATAAGNEYMSQDAGATWQPSSSPPPPAATGAAGWRVVDDRPALVTGSAVRIDADAPQLGGSRLVTAPAGFDYVVAVDAQSVVWRRSSEGSWSRALLLLPDHLGVAPPRVTALTSFASDVTSPAVYLGTDGFGVLASTDGGDDWERFDPGLPGHVAALAADAHDTSVFAASDRGLYVHHVQASPAPPAYNDTQYWWRVAGMTLVSISAAAAAIVLLRRLA